MEETKPSRLTLGTVQLGLDYGIANTGGRPDVDKACGILAAAHASGIQCLDTARSYGNAESVIGRCRKVLPPEAFPLVVSKFTLPESVGRSYERMRERVMVDVETSLLELGLERIPILLFHQGPDQSMDAFGEPVARLLGELVREGLVARGGLSAFHPEEALSVLEYDTLSCVQVPLNIMDSRLQRLDGLTRLRDAGATVFARSVYLQGLFFLDPDRLTGNLREAAPWLDALRNLAGSLGMSVAELSFAYVRDLEGVDSLVVGAEDASQVLENVGLLAADGVGSELRERIRGMFSDVPHHVLVPSLWKP